MTLIDKTLKAFDEKIAELSKLGEPKTAEDAMRYYCEIKDFITKALQEQDKESKLKANNKLITLLEKIKKIEPVTESDEMIQLASNIYADLLIMSLKQDEN